MFKVLLKKFSKLIIICIRFFIDSSPQYIRVPTYAPMQPKNVHVFADVTSRIGLAHNAYITTCAHRLIAQN